MRAFLDASEVTSRCQRMSRTRILNGLYSAEIRLASQYASITEGVTELIITDNGGGVLHAGPCWYGELDGDANDQMSGLTSFDPRVRWPFQQMMDADGDYSDPSIFEDFGDAVSIMEAALNNWIGFEGSTGAVAVNSATPSSIPLIGFKPSDFPWTLEYLWQFLCNTGELDVILVPASGGASTVNLFPGNAGTDLSGSVVFDYNTGSFNCISAKYTFDMKNTISNIRYFLGPKRPQYDGDIQHWASDVQIDDPALDLPPWDAKQPTIESQSASMLSSQGRMRETQVFDATTGPEGETALRDLYYALWQSEMLVRTLPRRILTVTPEPGITASFDVGDLITANAVLSGTVGGVQRVYGFTEEQDTEGNVSITQLDTSADGEV